MRPRVLVDEVDTEEMQNQTPKHIVRKRPLVAESLAELSLVGRVGLDAQRSCEHELADCGGEAGEEGVEGLGGNIDVSK